MGCPYCQDEDCGIGFIELCDEAKAANSLELKSDETA